MAKKPAKNNADASGLGYSVHDFQYPKRDPNITPATFGIYDNPAILNRQAMTPTISGVAIGQAGLGASGTVNPATINPAGTGPAKPTTGAPAQPASAFLSPAEQQPVKDYLANPQQLNSPSPMDMAKSWLSNLFDTSDTWENGKFKGGDNIGETVWDSMFAGLGWGYDRINQAGSWAVAQAPGGLDPFTWDQAGQVSWGQASVTNQAKLNEQLGSGLGTLAGTLINPVGVPGGMVGESLGASFTKDSFNILDEAQRKQAFETDAAGKWTAGLTDAVYTIFADPLIFAGKVAKIGRLKYIDRVFRNEEDIKVFANNVNTAAVTIAGGDAAQIARLSPEGQFMNWVLEKTPEGTRARTIEEIYNHRVIKYSTNREGLSAALYNSENANEAALVLRSAAGDMTAQAEMLTSRADLAIEIGDAQRKLNAMKFAYNPDVKNEMTKKAVEYRDRAAQRVKDLEADGMKGTPLHQQALRQLDQAIETHAFTRDLDMAHIDPLAHPTADTVQAATRAVGEMRRRDSYFMKAYSDETDRVNAVWGSLRNSTRGFSADNKFGRVVEASREQRAKAAYQASATRGARKIDEAGNVKKTRFWESDVFGNNGLTRSLRLWRYWGEESPSGFITTRSIGAQESAREVRAALNDVPTYSGQARTVTIAKETFNKKTQKWEKVLDKKTQQPVMETVTVGGVQRKEELVTRYMEALNDTTRGDMAAKMALDELERQVTHDISAWHKIDKETAESVLRMSQSKREGLVDAIKRDGYWVDDSGSVNQSPWLETHLQNGTYMLNFKAFEKKARLWDDTKYVKAADTLKQSINDKASNAYDFFNDLWRPAVLMRLGYTQRNVTEGLFRASAFQFSLDPLGHAAQQFAFGVRNAYVKRTFQGAVEDATVALRDAAKTGSPVVFPKKFIQWRAKQIAAREMDVANHVETLRVVGLMNAPYSKSLHKEMTDFFRAELDEARDAASQLKAAGVKGSRLEVAEGRVSYAQKTLDDLGSIKPVNDPSRIVESAVSDWRYYRQVVEDSKFQRDVLDADLNAVALFRQQGVAKRRVFDKSFTGPDHVTYKQAFDADSPYTPIALMNASADNTTRSMAALRMDTMDNALRSVKMRYYVNVTPDKPAEYFDGVARALRQFKYSEVGQRVIRGDDPEAIVKWLRGTPEGREIAAFVTKADIPKNGVHGIRPVDLDTTREYVDMLFQRWQQLAPSKELRDYVRANDLGSLEEGATLLGKKVESGWNGKVVETFLGQKDANGKFVYDLKPVVGNIAEETGFKSLRQHTQDVTNWGMKWLGTIPENAFVRMPFYGKRYQQTFDDLVGTIKAQTGSNYISAKEIDAIMRQSHRRALKDTKDWLYTIDRRTKLGSIGEYAFPFVSAAQNSITTVGRLIWNDPSIAAIMVKIWNAPNQMGIEDENGNIVIPIPHDFIPDGVEQALGIDNMMNWKINKSALNVVAPETGFGMVPRPGPLVVAPVSEIMKHGWFGISVESPEVLRGVLGKEKADAFWNVWKAYTFGDTQGLSDKFLSYDLFEPPVIAKLTQMIQGEGGSAQYAYYYNIQMRNEMAKYAAGLRDEAPGKDEIKQRTNGFYMARILANLTAFTPPQYESNLDPLINTIRLYDKTYGLDGARMANENLGNVLMMLGDFSNSKNIAGMMPYASSVESARKYSDLIQRVSPVLKQSGDLSVLSMLVNNDANAFYDDSAYAWQFSNQIPGVTDNFREMQTPEMALLESQKNAGWTAYISMMDQLDALLQQRGLSSYRSPGATDLRDMKYQAIQRMAANPLYQGWYADYKDYGSVRTENAVRVMEAALSDPQFASDQKDSKVWQAASYYLAIRNQVLEALNASPNHGISNTANQQIQDFWDGQRAQLIAWSPEWATFANRFLNGDDDPQNTGVQFGVVYTDSGVSAIGGTNGNAA